MNVSTANVTAVSELRASFTLGVAKNLIVVLLGIAINYVNGALIHTYLKHQMFYTNPRYVLFIHMLVNDTVHVLLTITLFFASFIIYKVSVFTCGVFVFPIMLTTLNTPLNLACMAAECYVAVCVPLRHAQICTLRRTFLLVALIWVTSLSVSLPDVFVVLATRAVDFFDSRVFCLRETVFPLPSLILKRDVMYSLLLFVVGITISFTYFKILFTAQTASKDARKARSTVLLHGLQLLLCMTTYAAPQLVHLLLRWFPKAKAGTLFAFYIVVQILPRSISPVIYGLRDSALRKHLKRYLGFNFGKTQTS